MSKKAISTKKPRELVKTKSKGPKLPKQAIMGAFKEVSVRVESIPTEVSGL